MSRESLKVRVSLIVTIDLEAYRMAYGDDPAATIREDIKQAAADGIRAVISQGIKDARLA